MPKTKIEKTYSIFLILVFVSCIATPVFSQIPATKSVISNNLSEEGLKRGQRFFMGLLPRNNQAPSCLSCHNIKMADTLNWNPSAMDIAVKFSKKDFQEFQQVVKQPSGKKLEEVHKNITIEDDDLKFVKLYLDNLALEGPPKPKPSISQLMLFLFLGLVITLVLLDLIFFKKIKLRFITGLILLGALSWQVYIVVEVAIKLGRQENYAPDQPIKFSHKVHAGENSIDCLYCHTTAEQSKSAGIPAATLCMNCHILIREGANSGKFEISKVIDAAENGHPVNWIRIHNLPDHVFFSHAIHVGSGKLDCLKCHGPVKEMDILRQENDLSMGWCINCHRTTRVNFKDNGYYDSYTKLHDDLKAGLIDSIKAQDIGATDCMKCHY